jgi:hypothetical protein
LWHRLLSSAKFYELLLKFDEELSAEARAAGCPWCRGRLDRANYPRKPRGAMAKHVEGYQTRFSFCCAAEGCRRRHTPPSLRFLGRRVYLGAIVVLACAMQQGATPVRARRLRELLGVSERTLWRWRQWWQSALVESDFWKAAKAFFMPPLQPSGLPLSLLERFGGDEENQLVALLRFLKPLSTPAGYVPDQAC